MSNSRKQHPIIWWALWLAFQQGICVIYYFMGRNASTAHGIGSPESLLWLVAGLPVAVSAILRWLVLPRIASVSKAFPVFIVGIAMAEACCFFGIFLFPVHRWELFLVSFTGILQFCPYYAGRFNYDA